MSAYWAVVSARFRVLLQYRAAAMAGLGTQVFWGLIRVMIFEAFYRSGTGHHPMSLPETVTYVWLGQAFLGLLPWNTDRDVRDQIRSGAVAYELLRPLDLYFLWYFRALALRTAPTILRAAPMFVIAGLFFGLSAPPSLMALVAWVASMAGALVLSCALTSLLTISMLWTISGEGVAALVNAGVFVLSGMIIPLPLFPDWAQPILNALPFRGLVDVPFRIYAGHIPPGTVPGLLAEQLAWSVIFILVGRAVLARGVRRLVVQGG